MIKKLQNAKNKFFRSLLGIRMRDTSEQGQSAAILAIAFVALAAFVGLVTDAGSLYVTYTKLKRAVDASAVSAANAIKSPGLSYSQRKALSTQAAKEMLDFNNVKDISSIEVYTCEDADVPPALNDTCPETGESPRKLVWVQATQDSPVYFLYLFGVENVPLTIHAIGEAATVDLVIVIDSSESMGLNTPGYGNPFDPGPCNNQAMANPNDPTGKCRPLWDAKQAAKALVNSMFEGYDQIGVINYDFDDNLQTNLTDNFSVARNAIDSIQLHDDAAIPEVMGIPMEPGTFNPLNVTVTDPSADPDPNSNKSALSTCTGCGIRRAGALLNDWGRPDSVWVIVLLSDGATNVSDVPGEVDPVYKNGFCGGGIGNRMWDLPWCRDDDPASRHCGPYHSSSSNCPPGSIWVGNHSPNYDVEDYARDMIDQVALVESSNSNEPIIANEIVMYTIGLGLASTPANNYAGEELLRYMANIGEDGSRGDDSCDGVAHQMHCGNYYYAPNASYLIQIFEEIANRIFTRISG